MTPKSPQANKPGIGFWFLWTLATAAAWAIFLALSMAYEAYNWFGLLWLDGFIIGLLQWLVLRRRVSHASRWLWATALGTFFAGAYAFLGGRAYITGALLFVGLQVAQWLALRRHVRRAGLWLLANVVASVLAGGIGGVLSFVLMFGGGGLLAWAVVGLVAGGAFGAATGIALVLLLRHPASQDEPDARPRSQPAPLKVFVALVAVILVVTPLLAAWRTFFLQSHLFCGEVVAGLSRAAVQERLARLGEVSESSVNYALGEQTTTVPQELRPYAGQVDHFVQLKVQDPLVISPLLGLGYDAADKVVLLAAASDRLLTTFRPVECPWTLAAFLGTLVVR